MSSYLKSQGARVTPQSEKIPGTAQVENSAGGFAFAVDKWKRLERFLVLGSEGGTYYVGERKLTTENAESLRECLDEDGARAVGVICDISRDGRAPRNTEAVFALAVACAHSDDATRKLAMDCIPVVCRTGTHLFQFCGFVSEQRGWGMGLRKSVARWYEDRPSDKLAYQLVKYRQREGWTHADVMRKAHPSPGFGAMAEAMAFGAGKLDGKPSVGHTELLSIEAFIKAQKAKTPEKTAKLIAKYGSALPREALLSEHLNSPEVWEALLAAGMPMTAMVRNLGSMSKHAVLDPMSEGEKIVLSQLADVEQLKRARVHPMALLFALKTYGSGHGFRGNAEWPVNTQIVDALDAAFYASFQNVEASGKRHLLALDVSGSMNHPIANSNVSCMEASAAMAMITAATEAQTMTFGFDISFIPLDISPRRRLDDNLNALPRNYGGTDCSVPMLYAARKELEVDVFVIYTDNETWAGNIHPAQALTAYRKTSGIDAKLIVCAMASNGFSIADPADAGMLDCVGFDASTPAVMGDFAR